MAKTLNVVDFIRALRCTHKSTISVKSSPFSRVAFYQHHCMANYPILHHRQRLHRAHYTSTANTKVKWHCLERSMTKIIRDCIRCVSMWSTLCWHSEQPVYQRRLAWQVTRTVIDVDVVHHSTNGIAFNSRCSRFSRFGVTFHSYFQRCYQLYQSWE